MKKQAEMHRMIITNQCFNGSIVAKLKKTNAEVDYGFQPKRQLLALCFSKTLLTIHLFERNAEA